VVPSHDFFGQKLDIGIWPFAQRLFRDGLPVTNFPQPFANALGCTSRPGENFISRSSSRRASFQMLAAGLLPVR